MTNAGWLPPGPRPLRAPWCTRMGSAARLGPNKVRRDVVALMLDDLAARWRARAKEYRSDALESLARLCERHADELETALRAQEGKLLTLTDAAAVSGFSPDHLGRLVRDGKLPNYGRPHAPRVRLADVPRKAGALPPARSCATLVGATPRQLAAAIATKG